jgi:hypothetical protein
MFSLRPIRMSGSTVAKSYEFATHTQARVFALVDGCPEYPFIISLWRTTALEAEKKHDRSSVLGKLLRVAGPGYLFRKPLIERGSAYLSTVTAMNEPPLILNAGSIRDARAENCDVADGSTETVRPTRQRVWQLTILVPVHIVATLAQKWREC